MKSITTRNILSDIVIIGSGGSAMFIANRMLELFPSYKVVICSSSKVGESSTSSAKGGINASLSNHNGEVDSWKYHAFDTIKSAKGLANASAVEYMCRIAPSIIKYLDKIGVILEKTTDGKIAQRPYGGQRLNYGNGDFAHRACYNKDKTGKAIIDAMRINMLQNDNSNLTKLENCFIYDIKYSCKSYQNINQSSDKSSDKNRQITDVVVADLITNEMIKLSAKIFVFASGGYSGIYESATSGDASLGHCTLSLLAASGANLKDIEFMQFHPTSMYKFGTLVSEACRSEGGYLENENGERFLTKYDPHNMELAPRDTISKAIFKEMQQHKTKYVYLNLTNIEKDKVIEKLANAQKNAEIFCGIDISKQRLMICPAAHYSMGGIEVDKFYRIINFSNAFAIGELACQSVHGANRLGCNSLLELFYSATLCLKGIKLLAKYNPLDPLQNLFSTKYFFKTFFKTFLSKQASKKCLISGLSRLFHIASLTSLLKQDEAEKGCGKNLLTSNQSKSALDSLVKALNLTNIDISQNFKTNKIRQIMDENLGIMRNKTTILKAQNNITKILKSCKNNKSISNVLLNDNEQKSKKFLKKDEAEKGFAKGLISTNVLHAIDYINFISSAFIGLAIARVSYKRRESRGSFYRTDYEKMDKSFCKNSIITLKKTMFNRFNFNIKFVHANKKISNQDLKKHVDNIKYE